MLLKMPQSEVNIGLVGHVDHGKTTLTKSLSGIWTDKHSEEIKRGISIRLGYAHCEFYKCERCDEPDSYSTETKCPKCGAKTKLLRRVSFVDAPGHETLIATMLSGASLMDGVILVIAADEECPQPQTLEHLMAIQIINIKNIIVVQNKVDIVSKEEALKNKEQIKKLLKEFNIDAPIIPIAANYDVNKDVLIAAIEEYIKTPEREKSEDPFMYLVRSFDVNKPGDRFEDLKGGVVGGSLISGNLRIGDEIEIKPGIKKIKNNQETWEPILTKITSLSEGEDSLTEVHPGGLIAVGTNLDPNLTKSDTLSGNVLGKPGSLPETLKEIKAEIFALDRKIGDSKGEQEIKVNDSLMLSIGTTVTVGIVNKKNKKGEYEIGLKLPVVAPKGAQFAISKRIGMRWRLVGYGKLI